MHDIPVWLLIDYMHKTITTVAPDPVNYHDNVAMKLRHTFVFRLLTNKPPGWFLWNNEIIALLSNQITIILSYKVYIKKNLTLWNLNYLQAIVLICTHCTVYIKKVEPFQIRISYDVL